MSDTMTFHPDLLVGEIGELAREIEDELLHVASVDAQSEWNAIRFLCPDLRNGGSPCTDDELVALVGKLRRFRDILSDLLTASFDLGVGRGADVIARQ